jgi:hypothetical protein
VVTSSLNLYPRNKGKYLVVNLSIFVDETYPMWMRSSRVVRASGCQRQIRNSPGFNSSILRHIGI